MPENASFKMHTAGARMCQGTFFVRYIDAIIVFQTYAVFYKNYK